MNIIVEIVVSLLLIGSGIFALTSGALSFHEILIALFILLTAPITANFISKVYIEGAKSREDLPQTGTQHGWAIYDDPPRK